MNNNQPCILVLQNDFEQIFNKLKEKYQENVSIVRFSGSKWIYTNSEYYLDIIKNSEQILGKQENCFNVSKTNDNEFLIANLGKISLCYFECKNPSVVNIIKAEISTSLSNNYINRFGKEQVKPISIYIDKKGHFYKISVDASAIDDYNKACDIINNILRKYNEELNYTTYISRENIIDSKNEVKQKILKK